MATKGVQLVEKGVLCARSAFTAIVIIPQGDFDVWTSRGSSSKQYSLFIRVFRYCHLSSHSDSGGLLTHNIYSTWICVHGAS
jgi:hypothetical protein